MTADPNCVGAIAGAFRMAGEVRPKSFGSDPTDNAACGALLSEGGSRDHLITLTRPVAGRLEGCIKGFSTKEQAAASRANSPCAPSTGCRVPL